MTRTAIISELEQKAAELTAAGDYWIQKRYTIAAEYYEKANKIKKAILYLRKSLQKGVNNMIIEYLILDEDNNEIYFGIRAEAHAEEVKAIINSVKEKYPGSWSTEDILDALPDDYEVFDIDTIEI